MLKIATWNVNSLKVRLDEVLHWLEKIDVDMLSLQETKLVNEQFPVQIFKDKGYHLSFNGQKSYNGVAIISKFPQQDVIYRLPDLEDPQCRFLSVTIQGLRLVNVYVPNGAAVGTEKYAYKLMWLDKLSAYLKKAVLEYPKLVVVGDFNIAPEDKDVHNPKAWEGSVLVSPLEREAFASLLALNLKDSSRLFPQPDNSYSWWDYRGGSFRRNNGLRIDHILLSEVLANSCSRVEMDINPRKSDRPSDHIPVICSIEN